MEEVGTDSCLSTPGRHARNTACCSRRGLIGVVRFFFFKKIQVANDHLSKNMVQTDSPLFTLSAPQFLLLSLPAGWPLPPSLDILGTRSKLS